MDSEVFNIDNVYQDDKSTNIEEALEKIAEKAYETGYVNSASEFYDALMEREEQVTTGFKDGIAIPHGSSETVKKAGLFLIQYENPIPWESMDGKDVRVAFALSIPTDGADKHLKILSTLARKVMNEEFREIVLNERSKEKLVETINQQIEL